jgi:hypothetical protein
MSGLIIAADRATPRHLEAIEPIRSGQHEPETLSCFGEAAPRDASSAQGLDASAWKHGDLLKNTHVGMMDNEDMRPGRGRESSFGTGHGVR